MLTIIESLPIIASTLAACAAHEAATRSCRGYSGISVRGRRSHQARSVRPRALIRAIGRSYKYSRLVALWPGGQAIARAVDSIGLPEDAQPGRVLVDDVRSQLQLFV